MTTIPVSFWIISLAFLGYFMITWVSKLKQAHNLADGLADDKCLNLLIIKLVSGTVLFLLPFFFVSADLDFLLAPPRHFENGIFVTAWLSLLLLIFYIAINSAKKFKITRLQFPNQALNTAKSIQYMAVRLAFLFCYELYFRGVLLFTLLEYTPLVWAICINSALYFIIHLFDSKQEIIGTLPFGIILCLISYYTKSIWPAFIMHAMLAGIYESTLIFYKPSKTSGP